MSRAQYADKRSMLHVIYPKLEAEKETLTPSGKLHILSRPTQALLIVACPFSALHP